MGDSEKWSYTEITLPIVASLMVPWNGVLWYNAWQLSVFNASRYNTSRRIGMGDEARVLHHWIVCTVAACVTRWKTIAWTSVIVGDLCERSVLTRVSHMVEDKLIDLWDRSNEIQFEVCHCTSICCGFFKFVWGRRWFGIFLTEVHWVGWNDYTRSDWHVTLIVGTKTTDVRFY